MSKHTLLAGVAVSVAVWLGTPGTADAQLLKKIRDAAQGVVEEKAANQVDRLLREAIRCYVGDPACYDFVPGEKVLYYEDYEEDNVGDFPRRLNFLRGNWQIVEWQGRRLLRNIGPRYSAFEIPLPETLPDRFTIEIKAHFAHTNHQLVVATASPAAGGGNWNKLEGNFFRIGAVTATNRTPAVFERVVPIRIMVDDQYAKVYVEAERVANVPNAEFPRSETLFIENIYSASDQQPMHIGAIRVAGGGQDLYDALEEHGRVATRGILFDVDSVT